MGIVAFGVDGSGSLQTSSPLACFSGVFSGFSDVLGEGFRENAFSVGHERHYTDVQSVFVESSWRVFEGNDLFAVVDFRLARLWLFVADSWFARTPIPLQVIRLLHVVLMCSLCLLERCDLPVFRFERSTRDERRKITIIKKQTIKNTRKKPTTTLCVCVGVDSLRQVFLVKWEL